VICKKHKEDPVNRYSKCGDCEIDNLRQQIKELQAVVKYFRDREKVNLNA
jgi:hypothetical protein